MNKEIITKSQAVSVITMFTLGSSLVLGISSVSRQDAWIGLLIAGLAVLPVVYIYARLLGRYPGLGLFDICIEVFGKIIGKIVVALYVFYAFYLGSLVLRNFSGFIQVRVFEQMPQTVSLLFMGLLVIWVCRRGAEALGRWSVIALPIVLALVFAVTALLVKDMKPGFLLPVGENLHDVPADAFRDFSFPFAETVLVLALMGALKPGAKPGGTLLAGITLGWCVLFVSLMRNILVLGFPMHDDRWFPSYDAASVIIAGSFISRIENVVGANLLLGGFVKISVCLYAASKGAARLFGMDDHRPFAAPLGLLMIAFASIVYANIMQMFDFIDIYPYFAFPFQVILPFALCIAAEIRHMAKNKKAPGGREPEPAK